MVYFVYSLLYLISLLPFWILYGISNLLYLILYKLVGYRTDVVRMNLQECFPYKSEVERIQIEKQFYKNLCDQIVETIKQTSISEKEFRKRFDFDWDDTLREIEANPKVEIWSAHFFNYEWCNHSFQLLMKHYNESAPSAKKINYLGVYATFTSTFAEKLFVRMRSMKGSQLCSTKEFSSIFTHAQNKINVVGLILDQNPSNPSKSYWIDFFNQKTAFYRSPEISAKRNNMMVYYFTTHQVKRGYYKGTIRLMSQHVEQLASGQLTKMYVNALEESITENPANWLWSHKRWKHKFKEDYSKLYIK